VLNHYRLKVVVIAVADVVVVVVWFGYQLSDYPVIHNLQHFPLPMIL